MYINPNELEPKILNLKQNLKQKCFNFLMVGLNKVIDFTLSDIEKLRHLRFGKMTFSVSKCII